MKPSLFSYAGTKDKREKTSQRQKDGTNIDLQSCQVGLHSTNTCVEARLLHGFSKHGDTNYLQALLKLSRNMLMLYTHAYQSFIWNQVASKSKELGLDVIEGDLVFAEGAQPTEVVSFIMELILKLRVTLCSSCST
jgi:tRNA(Glu) U13 pseudouridine synthase TruD